MSRSILSFMSLWMAVWLAGCAPQSRTAEPLAGKTFILFAEGVTPASDHEDPQIASLDRLSVSKSPPVRPVETMTVHPRRYEIKVGEVFSLKKLIITALDSEGQPIRHIPFTIECETVEPPIVEMQTDHPESIRGLRSGNARLRFVSRPGRGDGTHAVANFTLYVRP